MSLRALLLLFTLAIPAVYGAQEPTSSTSTSSTDTNKSADPRGPFIEITPLNGAVSTGYLLSMKDGVMDVQMLSGELKQEKTSELKSIHYIEPPPAHVAPAPVVVAKDADKEKEKEKDKGDRVAAKDPPKEPSPQAESKREDHKRVFELARKARNGKLTPDEDSELRGLRERIPGLSGPGGPAFIRGILNAEEDARQIAAQGAGKLDAYIVQHRQLLKDVSSELEVRGQVMRLVCAYREQGLRGEKISDQILKDVEQIGRDPVRATALKRVTSIVYVIFQFNGERVKNQ